VESSSSEYYTSGRHLWQRVIHYAMQEAEGRVPVVSLKGETVEAFRREAREWLTRESWDLRWICEAAGIEFREFVEMTRVRYGE
jgi:hypothetical protein